ncbi:MAG: hypothetical protein KME49_28225 [Brasilonema octagenarum HA4186-MV1]|jgi:hypothetical protein|nr:hypothetical protein [Brasilonema octagenarum HA4186-MV1]
MLDTPQRGKRGPAPSWKLGRTRAIRVPIVLADALLELARQIDNGEKPLVNTLVTESDKQVALVVSSQSDEEENDFDEEKTNQKRALAIMYAEAEARYTKAQTNFVKAQALFLKRKNYNLINRLKIK